MSNTVRPLFFISNDDGITAKGIHALIDYVSEFGDIIVVAPDSPQSGKSSALTVETPLRITQAPDYNGAKMYKINGTPVDCVKIAKHTILPRRPDFVLAGINHGANSGNSIIYSGTMGIVLEGCMLGIPSIGFSFLKYEADADFSPCEPIVKNIIKSVITNELPDGICLNVNIPADCEIKGIKAAVASKGSWEGEYENHVDPHGRKNYWLTGKFENAEPDNHLTDLNILKNGYASVVPCRPEQTAVDYIDEFSKRFSV